MVADELRRQADTFVELQDLMPKIARDQAAREASRSAGLQATLRSGQSGHQGTHAPSPASAMDDFDDEIDTADPRKHRSEEHTSELQSLMRTSYAVFCLKHKNSCTSQIYKQTRK